jgi:hypothetical protein
MFAFREKASEHIAAEILLLQQFSRQFPNGS